MKRRCLHLESESCFLKVKLLSVRSVSNHRTEVDRVRIVFNLLYYQYMGGRTRIILNRLS
jgi:hypothetical protein